jgi:hypothetical protein
LESLFLPFSYLP